MREKYKGFNEETKTFYKIQEERKMEENKVMTNEEITEKIDGGSGNGIGLGILIGSIITSAAIVGAKKLTEMIHNRKSKKEYIKSKNGDSEVVDVDSDETVE